MATKKKSVKAEVKEEVKEEKKELLTIQERLELASNGYFDRYPNVNEFFAVESGQFFFKKTDAQRNSNGGNVYQFKRK